MNDLMPRPWDTIAYGLVLVISLAMMVFIVVFLSSHCEWVYETTGITGACGIGSGWTAFALGFFAIAVYSGWELYRLLKARETGRDPEKDI